MATSYIITAGHMEESEYSSFYSRYHELERNVYSKEHMPKKHCLKNSWLVKPANENCGRGI